MQTENKYYIPTIEEFHVGFEFDINDTIRDGSGRKEWSYNVKTSPILISYIKWILDKNPEDIRVKYLDQEDIESLGWKAGLINIKNNNLDVYGIGRYVITTPLDVYNKTKVLDISLSPKLDVGLQRMFRGTIKNKSELNKLMKQLGINNA
jgi:hypothetical protein